MDSGRVDNISSSLSQPQSLLNADTFLDCMNALIKEISIAGFKSNKCVDAFLKRYRKDFDTLERYRVSTSDFTVISMLGKGAFGQVKLVRHNASENVYAMKCILKSEMLTRPEGMSSFWEERFIMAFAKSDWIVKCHWAFQDTKYLYMVMDYMPGGNLLTGILDNEDLTVNESLIRFYTAEMILAIEALHNMGFAHRDIKPDNCLINSKGHLKVTDFGTAIRVEQDGLIRCTTAVGTPDYISPEVLKSQSSARSVYGQECDWWSLGVVIYEMKYQDTPFYEDTLVKTYSRINNHVDKIDFLPDEEGFEPASTEIKDLIEKCLIADRTKRLGHNGARELKAHPFFDKKLWTWENIHTYPAPFDPQVESETDTKHFKYEAQDDNSNKFSSIDLHQNKNQFSAEQLPFIGFSYCPELFSRLSSGSASTETVSSLQKQLEEATKNSEKYQNGYNKAEMSRAKVETECNDLKRRLAKIEVENQKYIKKFEDVSASLHKAYADANTQKAEMDALKNENKKLKCSSGDKVTQLENEKQNVSESLSLEKNKNSELSRKLTEMEKRLKEFHGKWERECEENTHLINDLQNRQKEFDTVCSELSSSQVKVNALEDRVNSQKDQIDLMSKTESELKAQLEEKSTEWIELKRSHEQLKVLFEQSKDKIKELSEELGDLNERAKSSAIKEENEEITSLKKQVSQESEAKRLTLEKLRATEQELSDVKYNLEATGDVISKLKSKNSEFQSTVESLNGTINVLKVEKSKLNVELKHKVADWEAAKKKEVAFGKEVSALKESKKAWEQDKLRLEQELESSRLAAKETTDECESLRMKMTLLNNKIEDLKDDFSEVEKEKDDLAEILMSKEQVIESLEGKVEDKNKTIEKLENDIMVANQNLEVQKINFDDEKAQSEFQIGKKNEEIVVLRNLTENLKSDNASLNSRIKTASEEIQDLRTNMETLQNDHAKLSQERKRLIEHFSNYVNNKPDPGHEEKPVIPSSDKGKDNPTNLIRANRKLQMELDNHKAIARRYENEISNVRHEIDKLKEEYEIMENEKKELKNEVQMLKENIRNIDAGMALSAGTTGSSGSRNNSSLSSVLDQTVLHNMEDYRREGKLEIQQSQILQDKKAAGKKNQKFVEQYVVLESKYMLFYKTLEDRNLKKNATQTVDLTKLIHVRPAQPAELFRERKDDVEQKVLVIVFMQEEGTVRKKDPDVILEWAAHQMRDYNGNVANLNCDACGKPFKNATFTLRASSVAVIECKHCSKKYHKDRWDEEKLQMHKCPLANKANDIVMYLKAQNKADKEQWIKELNKFCVAYQKKCRASVAPPMSPSILIPFIENSAPRVQSTGSLSQNVTPASNSGEFSADE